MTYVYYTHPTTGTVHLADADENGHREASGQRLKTLCGRYLHNLVEGDETTGKLLTTCGQCKERWSERSEVPSKHAVEMYRNAPEPVDCPGLPDDQDCLDDETNPCKACIARGWADEGIDIEAVK